MFLSRPNHSLLPRQYYGYYGGYNQNCGGWCVYGRWILLGVIIAVALLVFFLFSCVSARRRRSSGYAPYRGTGWTLGRTPPGHAPAEYTGAGANTWGKNSHAQPQQENGGAPPPSYTAPGFNYGYYGGQSNGQQNGIEMQSELQRPGNAYQPNANGESYPAYAPPVGPPPGVIR